MTRAGISGRSLADVVRTFEPTILIGTSGQAGAFTDTIIRDMAAGTQRPVVLPFSNPTDYAEGQPADILRALEAIEARADRNGYVRARQLKRWLLQHSSAPSAAP